MLYDAANAAVDAGEYVRVTDAARRAASLPRTENEQDTLLGDLLGGVGSLIEIGDARGLTGVHPANVELLLAISIGEIGDAHAVG